MARPELRFAVLTDVGRKRKANEDSNLVIPDAGVFIVADGMGGIEGGAVASQQTVKIVAEKLGSDVRSLSFAEKVKTIRTALKDANRWIQQWAASRGSKGSGTTFVGLVLDFAARGRSVFLHAGDSRGYRYRGGTLQQITRDHSVASAFGAYNEKVPAMFKNVIVNAIGTQETFKLEETPVAIEVGDILLLCSDGLTGMVPDARIAQLIASHDGDLDTAATTLIKTANEAGGVDNITAVLVQVVSPLNAETDTEAPATDTHGSLPGADREMPVAAAGSGFAAAGDAPSTDDSEMIGSSFVGRGKPAGAGRSPLFKSIGIVAAVAILGVIAAYVSLHRKQVDAPAPEPAVTEPVAVAAQPVIREDATTTATLPEEDFKPDAAPRALTPDELKTLLAMHLDSGRLGELDDRLKKDPAGAMDQLKAMREESDLFTAWSSEWSRRVHSPGTVEADAKEYLGTLSGIAAILGIPPFSDSDLDWPTDAAGRANVYCRMLYKQQKRFVESATSAMDIAREQMNVLGATPDVVTKMLGATPGQKGLPEIAAELAATLADFRRWIERSKARPMMAGDLERVVMPYAASLQEQADSFRTELWARMRAISPETLREVLPSAEIPTVLEIKRRTLSAVAEGEMPPWGDKAFLTRVKILLEYLASAHSYANQAAPPAVTPAAEAQP